MRFYFDILFLGGWLSGQRYASGDESFLKPSISVHPNNVVALGGNVRIHCERRYEYPQIEFHLEQVRQGQLYLYASKLVKSYEAEFPILKAKRSDGGIYMCVYHKERDPHNVSPRSDPAYINVTDPSLNKPSIKMKPRTLLALGMNVTIECQGPEADLIYSLHKSQNLAATQVVETAGHPARFPLPLLRLEDAGSYTCQYAHREQPFVWSEASDPAELILKDPNLSKPTIEVIPKGQYDPGVNVTVKCQGPYKGLNFSLYKSKDRIAYLRAEPEKNTAEFHLNGVSLDNEGNYTCHYPHSAYAFVLSKPSNPVEIIVRGSQPNSDRPKTILLASCVGGLLLLVLLLLVAFILYRKKRKGSTANERSQPLPVNETNTFLEADAEEDPNAVSYAELNHHPLKNKQPPNPDGVSESCVYASVAKNGTRKGQ
ncbi:immunoglobulin superfamily member 1-like [Hemicordylus capensis]|uniref:immunoglobulin superfamily member 1-like n=1 Tax=Hemicordylus capensis TaxID=884348 RepID=UPI002304AE51|nr:immunoglobulin superfamily member 1-like [Hemicordylus capensis]